MKKKLIILIISILATVSSYALPPSSCDPVPSGIVAWWPGQNSANDIIGTNNGSPVGNLTYTNGEVGQAFVFDGSTSYIPLPASPSLDIGSSGSGLTIECWIKPSPDVNAPIIEWDSDSTTGVEFWDSNDNTQFLFSIVDTSGNQQTITFPYLFDTNNFQHVAATYDKSSGVVVLYINGASVASANFGTMTPQTTYPVNIGRRTGEPIGLNDTYGGLMDELSLYNRALSSNEIAAIYLAGSAGKCQNSPLAPIITAQPTNLTVTVSNTAVFSVTATGTGPLSYQWSFNHTNLLGATNATLTRPDVQLAQAGNYSVLVSSPYGSTNSATAVLTVVGASSSCDPPPSGIVAWWPGQGNASDIIGGNNGTFVNSTSFTNGEVATAFYLNNLNNFVLANPSAPNNLAVGAASSGLTFEGWINPITTTVPMPLFFYERVLGTANGADAGAMFYASIAPPTGTGAGCLVVNLVDTNQISHILSSSPGLVTGGVWQHVALTYDRTSGISAIYLNGSVVVQTNLGSFIPETSFTNLLLGAHTTYGSVSNPSEKFSGGLDELSLYNRALSSNEIAAIYLAGSAGKCQSSPLAPIITAQPTNLTVTVSNTAVFSVTATGTGPLGYQWSFNHTNLLGATNATLVLPNVHSTQAGNYSVLVSSPYGSTNSATAVLTVVSPQPPPSCDPPSSGIVAWWPGQGNASDIIGGNNGTLMNGTGFINGEVATAFYLNNINNFVLANPSASTNLAVGAVSGGLTFEGWINPITTTVPMPLFFYERVLGTANGADAGAMFYTSIAPPTGTGAGCLVVNLVDTNQISHILSSSPGVVTGGVWQHVALTYDRTSGISAIYLNGSVVVQTNLGSFIPETSFTNLLLGAHTTYGSVSNPSEKFSGGLDELSLYNRALSSNEIAAIYLAGSAGKCFTPTPPLITAQPTNQTVAVGSNTLFSVTATGTGPLSYQWSFNHTNLVRATNATLILTSVQLTNAGNYSVLVTNPYGSTNSATAVLTVIPPLPKIPVITSFAPGAAAVSNHVTIVGTNFSPLAASNIVYFGAVKAVVLTTSPSNLVVSVPAGATYAPITVTVNGLTAFAPAPFLPTFLGGTNLSPASLGGPVLVGTGSNPLRLAVGDLDGNGKPDLVVMNYGDGTIDVYRNLSTNGTLASASFAPPVVLTIPGGANSLFGLALADLDGDGRLDILAGDYSLNKISIFQNLSSPGSLNTNSFGAEVDIPVSGSPADIAVADLDGDGRADIVTANRQSNTVSILKNIGTGGLVSASSFAAPVNFATGPSPWVVSIGHLDKDGRPDVISVNQGDPNHKVSILRNLGTGNISSNSFAATVDLAGADTGETIAVGDLDGDGKLDLVVGSYNGQTVAVYRNTNAPGSIIASSFAAPVVFATGANVHWVALGDLDGDGKPDLAAVTEEPSGLVLYKNLSTPGSFTTASLGPELNFASGNNAVGVVIADLDGDGRPDIAFGNQYDATVEIYRNVIPFGSAPIITAQPTNQTVAVGSNTLFSVAATGTAPLSYQWSFNHTNLLSATNATLILLNVQLAQAGNYSVLVSSPYGSTNSATAVLTVVSPLPPSCNPPPSGIVAWWQGEGNGNDIIGGNTAVLQSSVGFSAGEVGQAFVLNSFGAYLSAAPSPSLNVGTNGGLTIEAWINPNNVSGFHPIAEWNNATGGLGAHFWLGEVPGDVGVLYANLYDTSGTSHTLASAQNAVVANAFQHVALTYDRTSGTGTLYLNGVVVAQASLGSFVPQTSYAFWMGVRPGDTVGDSTYGSYLSGKLDELSLYNRALSSNEIATIYLAGSAGKCTPAPLPLTITNQPVSQRVSIGCDVVFNVGASGTPPLSYQWWKASSVLSGQTNMNLLLHDLQTSNFASYFVVVTNSYGSITSSNAVLALNHPPVAGQDVIQRAASGDTKVQVAVLLTNDTDADGDTLTFVGVSSNSTAGGTVFWSSNSIYYQPPPGYTNSDAFTYTISDGYCGGVATGNVLVQVMTTNGLSHNIRIYPQPDGSARLVFAGVPSWTYRIQFADTLSPPDWTDLSTNTADASGIYQFIDVPPTNSPPRFYRSVSP